MRYVLFCAMLILASQDALAASIGVFSKVGCESCSTTLLMGQTGTVYIRVNASDLDFPVTGAEFRVAGLPDGWTAISTPEPTVGLVFGDPFADGADLVFVSEQTGDCIPLYRVDILAMTAAAEVVLRVVRHANPSNATFSCPVLKIACSSCVPRVCVSGGALLVNSERSCQVGVSQSSWTQMKGLFRQ